MFWNGFSTNFISFAILSFEDMVDFVLNIRSELEPYGFFGEPE